LLRKIFFATNTELIYFIFKLVINSEGIVAKNVAQPRRFYSNNLRRAASAKQWLE